MPQQKPLNCLQLNSQGSVRLLRRGEDIENYIKNITHGLDVKFEAVVDGDREIQQQSTGEVSTAPPMPEETTGNENVQPEEEDEVEILNQGIRQAVTEQVSDMVGFLETGRITVGTRELTFCVACGSSRHALRDCHTNYRPLLTSLQHMWLAIQHYPTSHRITIDREEDGTLNVSQQPSEADVSMDVETGSAASSTTRRPKPKPDHFNQPSWQMWFSSGTTILATLRLTLQAEEESFMLVVLTSWKLDSPVRMQWVDWSKVWQMLATDSYPNAEINRNSPWMWKLVGTSTKGTLAHLITPEEESWSWCRWKEHSSFTGSGKTSSRAELVIWPGKYGRIRPGRWTVFRWTYVITLAEYLERPLLTEGTALCSMMSSNVTKVGGSWLMIWSGRTSCGLLPAGASPNLQRTSEIATKECTSTMNDCNWSSTATFSARESRMERFVFNSSEYGLRNLLQDLIPLDLLDLTWWCLRSIRSPR